MRLYIRGPMRGKPNMNREAFHVAASQLRSVGFEVVSPAEWDDQDGEPPIKNLRDYVERLAGFLERDFRLIDGCDGVAFLDGSEKSTGARLEAAHAKSLGKPDLHYLEWAKLGPPQPPTILDEAKRLVYGDRNDTYGHPREDFARTATIWSAIIGRTITAQQVALCMVGVKISRECHSHRRDNAIDGAGYFATLDRLYEAANGKA